MTSKHYVIILSGKRKSGKDHVAGLLQNELTSSRCSILRLSFPLKKQYAEEHGLEFERLLDSSPYKELYRADMIKWGEEMRNKDPYIFIRAITKLPGSEKPVWVISDARRMSDITCLNALYPGSVIVVRITADDEVRKNRGWKFTRGVDDAESECGLDDFPGFDLHIKNNNDKELKEGIQKLTERVNTHFL